MVKAVIVKNKGSKPVTLTSAMMSHLRIKSRRGSAIHGLKGCSYCSHPPLASNFQIMSPADGTKPEDSGWSLLGSNGNDNQSKPGSWTAEEEKYTILRNKLSRVYAAPPMDRLKRICNTPPSKYETVDQGTGLGFRVIRMGYDDIYVAPVLYIRSMGMITSSALDQLPCWYPWL